MGLRGPNLTNLDKIFFFVHFEYDVRSTCTLGAAVQGLLCGLQVKS